jgi:hypothetical protein
VCMALRMKGFDSRLYDSHIIQEILIAMGVRSLPGRRVSNLSFPEGFRESKVYEHVSSSELRIEPEYKDS